MPRKKTGRVERRGDKFVARVAGKYVGSFDTEFDAEEANAAEILLDAEVADERSFCTLGEAYMQRQEVLTRTRCGHAHWFNKSDWPIWRRYIRTAPFYRKRVDKITRDEIVELLEKIVGSPAVRWDVRIKKHVRTGKIVGKNMGDKVRGRLHHFFKHTKGIKINPAAGVPLPNVEGVKRRSIEDGDDIQHLHLDEIERLYGIPLDVFTPMHRAVYAFGIWGGLRPAEIAGLEWPQVIHLYGEFPELRVRNSYDAPTKTDSSQRNLPMLPRLVAELRGYVDSLGVRPVTGYIFPGPSGGPRHKGWDADWYDYGGGKPGRKYAGMRTRAKIRSHIQYRHIRHTCATHLRKGNFMPNGHEWPLEKVAQLLGHESIRITRRHYASHDVDSLHKELAKGSKLAPSSRDQLLELLLEQLLLKGDEGRALLLEATAKAQLKKPR
jgi:integrase